MHQFIHFNRFFIECEVKNHTNSHRSKTVNKLDAYQLFPNMKVAQIRIFKRSYGLVIYWVQILILCSNIHLFIFSSDLLNVPHFRVFCILMHRFIRFNRYFIVHYYDEWQVKKKKRNHRNFNPTVQTVLKHHYKNQIHIRVISKYQCGTGQNLKRSYLIVKN